jgi:type IV pilus assembly protein PilN
MTMLETVKPDLATGAPDLTPTVSAPPPSSATGVDWTRFLVFGTSAGIAIRDADLEVALVRARPNGPTVVAQATISNYRNRPPAEWGREFRDFLIKNGEKHLAATILLPRHDVIVRLAAVPGVQKKDIPNALEFQIDSMHPYGEEPVAFGWAKADLNNAMVGIVRESRLDEYVAAFDQAGIAVAGFTFSASAIYSALRVFGKAPQDFAIVHDAGDGLLEIYGESTSKPVFSAEFDLAPARAVALAYSELRLTGKEPATFDRALPIPRNVIQVDTLAYATALASQGRWNAPYANLLPADRRKVQSRARFIPSVVLGLALLVVGISWLVYANIRDERYLSELQAEIGKVQPNASRADAIERRTGEHRSRVALLDQYRQRTQGDIEVLAELSRIIPPSVWTTNIDIAPDSVTLVGEADQAAPLLKILDSSPYFQKSEFSMGVMKGGQNGESFRIKTYRKVKK